MTEMIQKMLFSGYAASQIQILDVLVCMTITTVLAAYINLIYRQITKKSFYNKNFNMSLVALAIITAAVILTVQSNIVVSLGMVGALSIVRFRTAIKDPMDLVFLFWSITVGIICGAGYSLIAACASVFLTIVILVFSNTRTENSALLLVVNTSAPEDEAKILEIVSAKCVYANVKARNLTKEHLDMAIEVKTKEQSNLVQEILHIDSVISASLVSHQGDVTL